MNHEELNAYITERLDLLVRGAVASEDTEKVILLAPVWNLSPEAFALIVEFDDFFEVEMENGEMLRTVIRANPLFPSYAREELVREGYGTRKEFDDLPDGYVVKLWEMVSSDSEQQSE